jgi:hypothetical protein
MKTVPRRFYTFRHELEFELNPFTINFLQLQHKAGRVGGISVEDYENAPCNIDEVIAEPEDVLNFDAEHFPNCFDVAIPFIKPRFDGFSGFCSVRRVGKEMLFTFSVGLYEQNYYTYPLSLVRLNMEIWNYCEAYNLIPHELEEDMGVTSIDVFFICPARGNLLAHFNGAWKNFETLYYEARQRLIADVGNME